MMKTKSTFEDLEVWQQAREFRNKISELTDSFPEKEKYKLSDQILRASRSVTANIAEGYGRFHYQENVQFARQARGSLYETLDHLTVARDEGYIQEDTFQEFKSEVFDIVPILNGYIRYLKRQKENNESSNS